MRVGIVGGGPGGLYAAIMLKRDDPSRDVTLVEQNPPDSTYGWGVVFSADTLSGLREADHETWLRLDEELTRWEALDVRYRGTVTRSYGQGFSAIRRTTLLAVLQRRARELGVDLRFETPVEGVDHARELLDGPDLLVAADGVHSPIRHELADHLGVTATEETTRFVWFGAGRAFDAFTFVFRDTDDGLFTVHAYPIDAHTSTFIVECRPETWRAAGLDAMDEDDSLAFCEELFADVLDGAPLKSNKSIWRTFDTIRCRQWHHEEVVLVGDAVHTAHFSIGSGTKLAVEGAAALADALVEHPVEGPVADPDELTPALSTYELERQAAVERYQEAAGDSARYFATVGRYLGVPPEQFAFNLLTRSGRVTHRDVERRDPVLAARVDRWFARFAAGESTGTDILAPTGHVYAGAGPLLVDPPSRQPLRLRGVALANRVVLAPPPTDSCADGAPDGGAAGALAAAAATGAGLVVTDLVAVTPRGRVTPGSPGLWDDRHVDAWRRALIEVRAAGPAALAVRLGHAGRRGATRPRDRFLDRPLPPADAWELLGPTDQPYHAHSAAPRAMTADDRDDVAAAFTAAARRAVAAGVDLVLLDLSDGYLLGSYLSPLTNPDDASRGWPLEVVAAVRQVVPPDRPLGVRLTCDDRRTGGLTPDDAVATARRLRAAGVDLVDAVSGHTVPYFAGAEYRRGWRLRHADRVRNEAGLATIGSGGITTFDDVDTAVAAGRADLVVLDPRRYAEPRITGM